MSSRRFPTRRVGILSFEILVVAIGIAVLLVANIDNGFLIVGVLWCLALVLEVSEARDGTLSLTRSLICEASDTGRDTF
jgi:hypothetical protein